MRWWPVVVPASDPGGAAAPEGVAVMHDHLCHYLLMAVADYEPVKQDSWQGPEVKCRECEVGGRVRIGEARLCWCCGTEIPPGFPQGVALGG